MGLFKHKKPSHEQPIPVIDGTNNLAEGLSTLEALGLSPQEMRVMGSLAMVLAGIEDRRANDADIIIPDELYLVFRTSRVLPNGLQLTPEAPGKSSFSLASAEVERLRQEGRSVLPVEFVPASLYDANATWHEDQAVMPHAYGYVHQPLEVIAAHKLAHPHQDKLKAARDKRDAERIQRHLTK